MTSNQAPSSPVSWDLDLDLADDDAPASGASSSSSSSSSSSAPSSSASSDTSDAEDVQQTQPRPRATRKKKPPASQPAAADDPDKVCAVCVAPFSARLRPRRACPLCQFTACRSCWQTYLLTQVDDPSCMNCRAGLTVARLFSWFSSSWLCNRWRDHRCQMLLNRERAYLPEMMEVVARWQDVSRMRQQIITWCHGLRYAASQLHIVAESVEGEWRQLQQATENVTEHHAGLEGVPWAPWGAAIASSMRRMRHVLTEQLPTAWQNAPADWLATVRAVTTGAPAGDADPLTAAADGGAADMDVDAAAPRGERQLRFILPCPAPDCHGFLSTAYKCGLCQIFVCPQCRVAKGLQRDAPHTCRPEDMASVEALRASTRPCPECGVPIERSEGCAQMWCTQCHTAFDWNTGRKVTAGVIHNPHYLQFRMQGGGVAGGGRPPPGGVVDPCPVDARGVLTNLYTHLTRRAIGGLDVVLRWMANILRVLMDADTTLWAVPHGLYTQRWHLRTDAQLVTEHRRLRFEYLNHNINETEWKNRLYQLERTRVKAQNIRDVWDTFWQSSADIWGPLTQDPQWSLHPNRVIVERCKAWFNLVRYCNGAWAEASQTFNNCQVPMMTFSGDTNNVNQDPRGRDHELALVFRAMQPSPHNSTHFNTRLQQWTEWADAIPGVQGPA